MTLYILELITQLVSSWGYLGIFAKGYAFTQKDGFFYGVMPVREKLMTRDNPIACLEWKIGIIGRERLGFGVLDDKGLIEVTF